MLLPRFASLDDYRRVYPYPDTWLPAMGEIARRHGLPGSLRQQALGTHVVFEAGGLVVKLFCPLWPEDFRVESIALHHLHGLPIPRIVAEGQLEGWPYLVLSRLEGVPAAKVWPAVSGDNRRAIVRWLGGFLQRLHRQEIPPGLPADWAAFIAQRLARAESHHGLPEPWRGWIREQLAGFREPAVDPVLLNADLTDDHLLLVERNGTWEVGGVIDFGDARVGHPYYDLVAPLACYTFGRPGLSMELVTAYGLEPTPPVLDTLTRYCLLHEFGRLGDFLERFPVDSPEAFYTALWG